VVAGKVEVIEVFWYGCPHCFALEPSLDNWKQEKPANVEFERVPVMWGQMHQQHARLYYILVALGRSDLHDAVFNAIHRQGSRLFADTDEEARDLQRTFLMDHGVSAKKFDEAYDSKQVADNLARAAQITRSFSVGNVPTMIINGKYSTSVSQAGDETQLFALVNDLIASEQRP
jgi:thiol:disulfide interchange protein DsbA